MAILKINLYGESWMLKKFKCSHEELLESRQLAKKMKLTLGEALLNPFFYYNLRNPSIASLEHLPGEKINALANTSKNQIEILVDGKKIKKLQIKDLTNQLSLFPLYNTKTLEISEINEPGIYIEQKAIGFVASYELKIDNFSIENICFHLVEYCEQILFSYPTYKNKNFLLRKKSTLVTYQNSFEIL